MNKNISLRVTRLGALTSPSSTVRCLLPARSYASQIGLGATAAPTQKRGSVTLFNDNGLVPWSQLSSAEKVARATQQSFNFGLVMVGLTLTVRPRAAACPSRLAFADPPAQGRCRLFSLDRRSFPRRQDCPVQPRRRQNQEGGEMHRAARRPPPHHGPR